MPRPAKGARLYLRKRAGRDPQYVILDTGGIEVATGTDDRRAAEDALAQYIAERWLEPGPTDRLTCAEALTIYGRDRGALVASPERIGYGISALLPFWGPVPTGDVSAALCRRYAAQRPVSGSSVRRELGVLRAALNYCAAEGYIKHAPRMTLPEDGAARDRYLSEAEAARLLRATKPFPHLARFVLLGLYTGSRKAALLSLSWTPQIRGGWIDLERGVMYRQGPGDERTKKRQPPVRLPRKLLAHCRRWREDGSPWVIHWGGRRIHDIRQGWRTAREAADLPDIVPHTLRHTAITWACQRGVPLWEIAGYFGVTQKIIENVYGHHHPDFQKGAAAAMDRGSLGLSWASHGRKP